MVLMMTLMNTDRADHIHDVDDGAGGAATTSIQDIWR